MGQNDPAVGRHDFTQALYALGEEKHHRGVIILAAAVLAAIKEIADGIDADDVRRGALETLSDCFGDELDTLFIDQHFQFWGCDEPIKRGVNHCFVELYILQPLAQVVILNLCL